MNLTRILLFCSLVGLAMPSPSTAQTSFASPTATEPTVVKVGVRIRQITGIDQQAENYGVVADVRMEWTDPKLRFSREECKCTSKILHADDFIKLARNRNTLWPEFYFFNKQGRAFYDLDFVNVDPNGNVALSQTLSMTLQAPDFDFHQYPFDQQTFFVRIISFFPRDTYIYAPLEGFSGLGEQLGEEEWVVTDFETTVNSYDRRSMFNFRFTAERHWAFYILRVFVPVIIIITISWGIFFLADYSKRIDVSASNLLLFIAFNWVIAANLPKLGYMTFMDAILVTAFIVTGGILIFCVYLRRLEIAGKKHLAQTIDGYVIWLYPALYLLSLGGVVVYFF